MAGLMPGTVYDPVDLGCLEPQEGYSGVKPGLTMLKSEQASCPPGSWAPSL